MQLPLDFGYQKQSTFENFIVNRANQAIYSILTAPHRERFIYLYGNPGAGCTHLLLAACHRAERENLGFIYFPMQNFRFHPYEWMERLCICDVVCLDNVDIIAGHSEREEALFHLFNRLQEGRKQLLIGARKPAAQLPFFLKDLQSRLCGGLTMLVSPLHDEAKKKALHLHAKSHGFSLSDEVLDYIIGRSDRRMSQLTGVLDYLGEIALCDRRRLTIPFVKKVMRW